MCCSACLASAVSSSTLTTSYCFWWDQLRCQMLPKGTQCPVPWLFVLQRVNAAAGSSLTLEWGTALYGSPSPVVRALENLHVDLVLIQLALSGYLLGFPEKKVPFITYGHLYSSPVRYLSQESPLLSSRAQCPLTFSIVAPWKSHTHTTVNTRKPTGLCWKMHLTTFKSMCQVSQKQFAFTKKLEPSGSRE